MRPKHKRLMFVCVSLAIMAMGAAAILTLFKQNLIYFYTPSMLKGKQRDAKFDPSRAMRIGGLVKTGSVKSTQDGAIQFSVTDGKNTYPVSYKGIIPNLFREGQGVVILGKITPQNTLVAQEILAKHDENYMPPEVARALKESGHWKKDNEAYPSPENMSKK